MGKRNETQKCRMQMLNVFWSFPFYDHSMLGFFSLSPFITDIRPVFELKIIDHDSGKT